MDKTQEILYNQLNMIKPGYIQEYGISKVLEIENGLRLMIKHRYKITNIDITYDKKTDYYNIKAVEISANHSETIWNSDNIHYMNLHKIIKSILNI